MSTMQTVKRFAQLAIRVLRRISGLAPAGSVLRQLTLGHWPIDPAAPAAADLITLSATMTERVRWTGAAGRGLRRKPPTAPSDAATKAVDMRLDTGLPLNRKERFYTGTVLPMLVASDGFAYLDRLLHLCGLDVKTPARNSLDGTFDVQFFTEYSFRESRFTEPDRTRFANAPVDADTPDVVLLGPDWLLALEAKVFHNPLPGALDAQMARQQVLVRYWARCFQLEPNRVKHFLLLPNDLPRSKNYPVITWEKVLDAYRNVAPTYWVGVLTAALDRYPKLVSVAAQHEQNMDAKINGQQIWDERYAPSYTWMGRRGGATGDVAADVESGKWRTQPYEVRYQPLPGNPNWFPIEHFLKRVEKAIFASSNPAAGLPEQPAPPQTELGDPGLGA